MRSARTKRPQRTAANTNRGSLLTALGAYPQHLAEMAAEKYFSALSSRIPFDNPPGDVNLIEEYNAIRAALIRSNVHGDEEKYEESYAMDAGFLLGVAIGRRLGPKGGA